MPGPNVSVSRDLINDYIYRIIGCIDITIHTPEDLKKAREMLLEMSRYITQAPIESASQKSLPSISRR
jgi:hypothetical protein